MGTDDDSGTSFAGREVTTEEEVESVRTIRNQARLYMTRSTASIGPDEQARWWRALDKTTNRLFVFEAKGVADGIGWRELVGYGLNRLLGEQWWLSGALANDWQGKGMGSKLFCYLVEQAGTPCWLEVLSHNVRARNTYKKLGFVEIAEDAGIITMVKR